MFLHRHIVLETFDRELDDVIGTFARAAQPTTLYHYTRPEGAVGILQSRQLWATHSRDTGDPQELHVGDEAFLTATEPLIYHPCQACRVAVLTARERYLAENVREIGDTFLACFTPLDASPDHFARFGPVAVGFKITDEPLPLPDWRGYLMSPVRYGERAVWHTLRRGLSWVAWALHRFADGHDRHHAAGAAELAQVAMLRIGALCNVLGKREDLLAEREWRLGVIQRRDMHPETIKRRGQNGPRYIEFDLRAGRERPLLAEIVVCDPALVPKVRACLEANGYPPGTPLRVAEMVQAVSA